jgi:hypothetical protein
VYVCAVVFYLGSAARERVYQAVAPSNAGYAGMFETHLSVCLCSGFLFGVRSEAELLPRERVCRVVSLGMCLPSCCPGKVISGPLPREIFCVFVPKQQ